MPYLALRCRARPARHAKGCGLDRGPSGARVPSGACARHAVAAPVASYAGPGSRRDLRAGGRDPGRAQGGPSRSKGSLWRMACCLRPALRAAPRGSQLGPPCSDWLCPAVGGAMRHPRQAKLWQAGWGRPQYALGARSACLALYPAMLRWLLGQRLRAPRALPPCPRHCTRRRAKRACFGRRAGAGPSTPWGLEAPALRGPSLPQHCAPAGQTWAGPVHPR